MNPSESQDAVGAAAEADSRQVIDGNRVSIDQGKGGRSTPKEVEAYIPPLDEYVGNYKIVEYFNYCLRQPAGTEANSLIMGTPGTGKTNVAIGFLRQRLNNPLLCGKDLEMAEPANPKATNDPDAFAHWQTGVGTLLLAFVQIDGATEKEPQIRNKVSDVRFCGADHSYVIVDEGGELYFRGLEEMLRPMLTDPKVTTIMTAQNFHSKRRSDSKGEDDDRLRALVRRFPVQLRTENPSKAELIRFLAKRIRDWRIEVDSAATIRLIAEKSNGVVGYALRPLVDAVARRCRLTRDFVLRSDIDPIFGQL